MERGRAASHARLGARACRAAFAGWGIPTADALIGARAAAPSGVLIASGGIRDGIDVAKALTLGADSVGIAGPFVRAAAAGDDALEETVSVILEELRLAMFCVGAARVFDLRSDARLVRRDGRAPGATGSAVARGSRRVLPRTRAPLREFHSRLPPLAAIAPTRPDSRLRVLQVHGRPRR